MSESRRQAQLPVLEVQELGASQILLRLDLRQVPGGAEFRAGQFAQLAVPGHTLPRPLSILRAGPESLDFLIKVVGPGTAWLAARRPGESLPVLWPLGHGWLDRLELPDPAEHWILVGGGVGIAPLIALCDQTDSSRALSVAFGFRDQEGVEAVRGLHAGREIRISTEDGSLGRAGRVTELLHDLLQETAGRPRRIFCCGPDPMMEAVARVAREAELPCLLSLETLMGCGIGICGGCAVPLAAGGFRLACQDGPVFSASELAPPPLH